MGVIDCGASYGFNSFVGVDSELDLADRCLDLLREILGSLRNELDLVLVVELTVKQQLTLGKLETII